MASLPDTCAGHSRRATWHCSCIHVQSLACAAARTLTLAVVSCLPHCCNAGSVCRGCRAQAWVHAVLPGCLTALLLCCIAFTADTVLLIDLHIGSWRRCRGTKLIAYRLCGWSLPSRISHTCKLSCCCLILSMQDFLEQ